MLALILATMGISPWSGAELPTSTQAAAQYRLTIAGRPGQRVTLSAGWVAPGWIAAFCDARNCSPTRTTQTIPKSGSLVVQFELMRETEDAPHRSGAVIASSDGSRVIVPSAVR